jgi:hypothetical protein
MTIFSRNSLSLGRWHLAKGEAVHLKGIDVEYWRVGLDLGTDSVAGVCALGFRFWLSLATGKKFGSGVAWVGGVW